MDYKNIEGLIKVLSESNLTYLELTEGDTRILMRKDDPKGYLVQSSEISERREVKDAEPAVKEVAKQLIKEDGKTIKAPIVGTVYLSSSPDSETLVKIGDKISKGQTVCIIEAMKLMNEIQSDFDGTIEEILVENMQMVEYGEPLFKIKG